MLTLMLPVLEPSISISRDLYCSNPNFFPLRSVCVYVSDEKSVLTLYHAQFNICGQQALSDLYMFSKVCIFYGNIY